MKQNDRLFPYFLHGADYNPEQWDKSVWDEDMRLMRAADCNTMTVGIFAWSFLETRDGEYDFSWLDEIIERIGRNGGNVVLATPSGARPHWLADKYPEVLRVDSNGVRNRFGGRHNHCYTSKAYRDKVRAIDERLSERYGKNPTVVCWHLSNEYGGYCYCPACQAAFRKWLQQKYKTIDALNAAYWSAFWSHRYDGFEQIEAPVPNGETSIHGLNLDWRRFCTQQAADFMRVEIEAVKKYSDKPVTTNMMPAFYDYDYRVFAPLLDVISWDAYPSWHSPEHMRQAVWTAFWHDCFRSLKDRPFMLMESAPGLVNWKPYNKLNRPDMDTLAALCAVAHGSDTVQYFQWRKSRGGVEKFHGAVVDHVGTENTRIFRQVSHTGKLLRDIAEVVGTPTEGAQVAVMFDWENRWALDDAQGFCKNDKGYEKTCVDCYRAFWKRGIACDVVGAHADLGRYKLVVAPKLYMTDSDTVARLTAFVERGGRLYATVMTGYVDGNDLCYLGGFPAENLKEVFGIWNEEIDTLYPADRQTVVCGDKTYSADSYCEHIHAKKAAVRATFATDFYADCPAFTENAYGKGVAYYQAFCDDGTFFDDAVEPILRDCQILGAVPALPDGVTAGKRIGKDAEYLFVQNFNGYAASVELGDVYTDMQTNATHTAVDLSPYGIRVLSKRK